MRARVLSLLLLLFLFILQTAKGSHISSNCDGKTMNHYYSGIFKILHYNNRMECTWRLHAHPGERVLITFTNFSTESFFDFVQITDDNNRSHVIGKFSGNEIPPVIVSCSSTVLVTFVSDYSVTRTGFEAIFESRRYISPNRRYYNDQTQSWIVCATPSMPLCMHFSFFDITQHQILAIETNRGKIANYSKSLKPPKRIVMYATTFINLTSGRGTPGLGFYPYFTEVFKAEFCLSTCPKPKLSVNGHFNHEFYFDDSLTCVCSQVYKMKGTSSTSVRLKSSSTCHESCGKGTKYLYYSGEFKILNYHKEMRCEWHIHARPGERVFINFTQFSTETDYDFVEIRDSSNRSIVLGRFSGSQLPPVVISCNSSVLVTFFSDHMINGLGFSATFESKGAISSSGFPNSYRNEEKQSWTVCASKAYPLCMIFTDFNTQPNRDFVQVSTISWKIIGIYSGSSLPPALYTSQHTRLNFSSDPTVTGIGFKADFCISTCPVLMPPDNGYLNSSLNAANTRVQLLCHSGYIVVGNTNVLCQASGAWSGPIGHCRKITCPPPPSVANGHFVGTSYNVGDEVILRCNLGYYVAGGRDRFQCSLAGVWSFRSRMACYIVSCGRPIAPLNGSASGTFSFGSSTTFSCYPGFKMQGQHTAICLATGKWSHSPPTCLASDNVLTKNEKMLLDKLQKNFFERYATYTQEAQPPPSSVLRSSTHPNDSILALDLILVLDTSGSVGEDEFETGAKVFARRMSNAFHIAEDSTHIGAIAFGTKVYKICNLTSSQQQFTDVLNGFQYKGGMTNTTGALQEAIIMFLSSLRKISRLKRVLILVTDGKSNMHKLKPYDNQVLSNLSKYSIERYVFGITSAINQEELENIASPPPDRHVFYVDNFNVFRRFAEFIGPGKIIDDCGIAGAPGFHARVLNGQLSLYGGWPWLAAIYTKGPKPSDQFKLTCGGTLVNKRWIVTAAHCIFIHQFDKQRIQVKLGDHFRFMVDPYEETYGVDERQAIIFGGIGKYYNPYSHDNDIALIKLNRDVTFNRFVRPICLLKPFHHNDNLIRPGSRATIVGWGYFTVNGNIQAVSPRETTVTIHDNLRCNAQRVGRTLTDAMICARGNTTDACPGDSGGPLMCQADDNRFSLCGIVSFGKGKTCNTGYGVYTKTFKFMTTIKSVIRDTS